MTKMWWGNCWFWGIGKFLREGGYLGIRRSRHMPYILHCMWSSDLVTWYGFVPVSPKEGFAALLDMWWFLGAVKKEAKPELPPEVIADEDEALFEFHGSPNQFWKF